MPDDFVSEITERYIELYEKVTGKSFERSPDEDIEKRIERNILRVI